MMERVRHQYSDELTQRIVEEIERGHLSLCEAAREVRTNAGQVHRWVVEYGPTNPNVTWWRSW